VNARKTILALALLFFPAAAKAQEFELAAEAGYFRFAASNSAKAIFNSSGGVTFGAEFDVLLSNNFYVGVDGRYFKKDGSRVFVANAGSPVFPLMNEPLSGRLIPLEATIGYRFHAGSSVTPYLGIGPGFTLYHEESTVGGITSTFSETKFEGHAVAGVELGSGEVRLGVEVNYSIVPNAIGIGGVSQIYNEKDLGGLTILGKLTFTSPRH
jgi:opacity protein-like surface antigen